MQQEQVSEQLSVTQLLTAPYLEDPYPLYRQMREKAPVYWDEAVNCWIVTGYKEVKAMLLDQRIGSGGPVFTCTGEAEDQQQQEKNAWILQVNARQITALDPPDHTRIRRTVRRELVAPAIVGLRAFIQETVDHGLEHLAAQTEPDFLHDFSHLVMARILVHVLGLPAEATELFIKWEPNFTVLSEGDMYSTEQVNTAWIGMMDSMRYFQDILENVGNLLHKGVIYDLVQGKKWKRVANNEEILGNCILTMITYANSAHLMSNSLLTLLRHPDQLALWRNNLSLTPTALEELLRYEPVVRAVLRKASREVELGGKLIKKGQLLLLYLAAANRDPAYFANPEHLDITRADNRHLAFGFGIHRCLGLHLAYLEAEVIFTTLLRRFPHLRLGTPAPRYQPSLGFRFLDALSIVLA